MVIVIDGAIFQIQSGGDYGIARVWRNLIPLLQERLPSCTFVFLQRGSFSAGIPDVPTVTIQPYYFHSIRRMNIDDRMLTEQCTDSLAQIFMSTYYTRAPGFHSVQLVYDCIPERCNEEFETGMWHTKRRAFAAASSFIAISESTRGDLSTFYGVNPATVPVVYPGTSPHFFPASDDEREAFRKRHHIDKQFYLLVGYREDYKNARLAFEAYARDSSDSLLVTVGGVPVEPRVKQLLGNRLVELGRLSDGDLRAAYSCATAFLYPSLFEGFGMPIVEAQACGCPVITSRVSSMPEAGGDACLYIDPHSVDQLQAALREVGAAAIRSRLREAGFHNARRFTWDAMARVVAQHLQSIIDGGKTPASAAVLNRRQSRRRLEQAGLSPGTHFDSLALQVALSVLDSDPSFAKAHLIAARAAGQLSSHAVSYAHYEYLVRHDPSREEYATECAAQALHAGRGDAAVGLLTDFLVANPGHARVAEMIVDIQEEQVAVTELSIHESSARIPEVVTVIIVAGQSEALLSATIGDIEVQDTSLPVGTCVVAGPDDQACDGMADRVIRYPPSATPCAAINAAIMRASGDYIVLLSAGDRLDVSAISSLHAILDSRPGLDLVHGAPSAGVRLQGPPESHPQQYYTAALFFANAGGIPLWRRALHRRIGYLDTRYRANWFLDFWLRCGQNGSIIAVSSPAGRVGRPLHGGVGPRISAECFDLLAKHQDAYLAMRGMVYPPEILTSMLKRFLAAFMELLTAGDTAGARVFYARHRDLFPFSDTLSRFDDVYNRLSADQAPAMYRPER